MQGQVNDCLLKEQFHIAPHEEIILYKLQTILMEHANNLKKGNTEV